jgi:hypothetical protein
MTPAEQTAFVKAYIKHVDYNVQGLEEVVHKIVTGEKVQHPQLTSILDTLGIWFEATKHTLEQQQ